MSSIHERDRQLFTVSDLLAWKPPSHYRIISGGILNVKNRMLLFGDEGSWKSILAIHTSHCIARGSRWLGFYTYPANVLRMQVELPMYTDRSRLEKYCAASKDIYLARDGQKDVTGEELDKLDNKATDYAYPENAICRTEQFIHIDESSGWESLKRNILNCIDILPKLPLVVILDPLYKMFNRNLSEELDVKPLLDKIDLIMEEVTNPRIYPDPIPGISFIIVHHTRKSHTDDSGKPISMGSQDASGSRSLVKWADTVLRIDPVPSDETLARVVLRFTKHRNAEDVLPTIVIRWDRNTLHPQILSRHMPIYEDEDELKLRGDARLEQLE